MEKVMEFEELKRVRTLHQATFVYLIPGPIFEFAMTAELKK